MTIKNILDSKLKFYIFVITVIGLSLRIFRLGYHDLWYDEAKSALFMSLWYDGGSSISFLHKIFVLTNHPPLFYSILHLFMRFFGHSEFVIRFPAMIFSTASIPLIYYLGKKLFGPIAALLATCLMAFSPFQLWYAQEARPYSMMLFFGLLSSCFLISYLKKEKLSGWGFTLSSVFGMHSSYLYIFLLASQLLIVGFFYFKKSMTKIRLVKALAFFIVITMISLPLISRYFKKFIFIKKGFWIQPPDMKSLVITFENLLLGYNLSQFYYYITDFVIVVLSISAFVFISKKRHLKDEFLICLTLAFMPVVAIFLFSKINVSVYLDRYFILFSPYFYIVLSLGLAHLLNKKIALPLYATVFILFSVSLKSFYTDKMPLPFKHHTGTYIKKPIKPLVSFLEENAKEGDIIAFSCESSRPSWFFYSKKPVRHYVFYDPDLVDTNWNRPNKEEKDRIPMQKIPALDFRRIWLIASDYAHSGKLDPQSKSVKNYMDGIMKLKMGKNINGVWVYLYER